MPFAQMHIQEQWFDVKGNPASGFVLKAYETGDVNSPISIFTSATGASPQATITLNPEGKYEVSGNEILPYIDRDHMWALFKNKGDAAANANPFAGFYDNVPLEGANAPINFDTIDLATASTLDVGSVVFIKEYATGRGIINATYDVVASAMGTDDGFEFHDSDAAGLFRLQLRIEDWPINVKLAGTVGDGVADDVVPIQLVIDFVFNSTLNLGAVYIPTSGRFFIGSDLTIKQAVDLVSDYEYTDFTDRDYWPNIGGAILLDSTATIHVGNGAGLKGLLVFRSDMTFPAAGLTATEVALYAGTAVTVDSAAPYIRHCTFLGFTRAIDTAITNTPRGRIEFVNIDCTNGVRIDQDLGAWTLINVYCQPILSDTDIDNLRTGVGFEFDNRSDWTQCVNCFTFQDTGFLINDCNQIQMLSCMADHPTDGTDTFHTGKGFRTIGSSTDNYMVGCRTASHLIGYEYNTDDNLTNYMTECRAFNLNSSTGVNLNVLGGNVNVVGGRLGRNFATGGKGLVVNDVNSSAFLTAVNFDGLATAIDTVLFDQVIIDDSCTFKDISSSVRINEVLPSVASAGTLTLPKNVTVIEVTGTTNIGTILGAGRLPEEIVRFIITDAAGLTVNHGNTLLAGSVNAVLTQNSTLSLVYTTGNTWIEVGRSVA